MTCGMSNDRLWAWVHDEEDDDALCAEVARHVEDCAECGRRAAEMRALLGDIGDAARVVPVASAAPPDFIGPYRIIRKIGQGGMGVVYEAEQPETQRRVALKVIIGGRHVSDLQIKLFQREIISLARLNHPAIAAIYQAGRTEDGNHYFAMELVEGVTLLDDATVASGDRSAAAMGRKLELFMKICDGVNYAHQRGVIHRDLKPSNILMTAGGQPRILDFGLARIIDDEGADGRSLVMESGRLVGTLPYMSPEQARGSADGIDLRSDVYALGVILYQMLTGEMPYRLDSHSILEKVRIICDREPEHPRRLAPEIPRDVATINLKALAKDPARRYQSVAAMAEDIDRFRKGYPIHARPLSTVYHLRKMIARHKIPAMLMGLLIVSIAVTGVVAVVQARRIAGEAAKKSRIIAEFEALYEAADPWKAGRRDVTVLETLNARSREIEAELEDDPLVAAAVRNTMGMTYLSFSEFDGAESHLSFALSTRERLLGDADAETAESLNDLGELRYFQERLDDAEELWRRALSARRESGSGADVAETLNNIGNLLRRRGKLDEAERHLKESLLLRRRVYADAQTRQPNSLKERRRAANDVAQTLNNLGGLYRSRAGAESILEAERCYREALRIRLGAFGPDHPEVAKMQNNLGKFLEEQGDIDGATDAYRESLRIMQRDEGLGRDHQYIARVLHNLASLAWRGGDADEAGRFCEDALQMRIRVLGETHPETAESRRLLTEIQTGRGAGG